MTPDDLETLADAVPASGDEPDGRKRRGRATRDQILEEAAHIGSVEGLEGITLGRLATELGLSKSGLFAHFGSKEELQLATMEHARRRFVEAAIRPSRGLPRGRVRLEALLGDWLHYYASGVFRGGCLLDTVAAEYDSRPDGPVRAEVKEYGNQFMTLLTREISKAVEAGDLRDDTDVDQLAFELKAFGAAANHQFQLNADTAAFERAQRAMASRLDMVAVDR